jgi:predicted phosphodiesterase
MKKIIFFIFLYGVFATFHMAYPQDSGKIPENKDNKLFAFGIIADVQYADAEKAGKRDYRNSLNKLEKCIAEFNKYDLAFTISLGDLIDRDFTSFDKPQAILNKSKAPVYNVIGNHEFSVEEKYKRDIRKRLNNHKGYFKFVIGDIVFLILDGTAMSTFAHSKESKSHDLAMAQYDEMKKQGLNNATTWNGGIGENQFKWLEKKLKKAEKVNKKVILFCHWPLLPENGTQLWNNREVLDLINSFNCVLAWISGHHHAGHYEKTGNIHHLTINGMVEAQEETSCGIIQVYSDKLWLNGFGDQKDYILQIQK